MHGEILFTKSLLRIECEMPYGYAMDDENIDETPDDRLSWPSLLYTARAPAGLLLATIMLLLFAPQTQDMLEGLWDGTDFFRWPAVATQVALTILGFTAWHWSRAALSARFRVADDAASRRALAQGADIPVDPAVLIFLPRLLFLAALALAIIMYLRDTRVDYLRDTRVDEPGCAGVVPSYCIIILTWLGATVFVFARLHLPRGLGGGERTLAARSNRSPTPVWLRRLPSKSLRRLIRYAPLGPHAAALGLAISTLTFVAGVVDSLTLLGKPPAALPLWLGRAFPGPGAALLCLCLLIAPLTALTFIIQMSVIRWRGFVVRLRWLPSLAILVTVTALVPVYVDLHAVRAIDGSAASVDLRPNLQTMLDRWAKACGGTGKLHPVIVAVSGGASRAAVWGASVLFTTDKAARAAHTGVFAVSSVSGGSLGAAAYMAWLRGQKTPMPCGALDPVAASADGVMRKALGADALGPLLAGALIADIPRDVVTIPWAVPPALKDAAMRIADVFTGSIYHPHYPFYRWLRGGDRAEALERAFEANWQAALTVRSPLPGDFTPIGFDQPYLKLDADSAAASSAMPIWIANGTDQQSGERLLTVPFRSITQTIGPGKGSDAGWPFDGAKDVLAALHADMPISAVIDNTCRFPLLSPVGELTPLSAPSGAQQSYPLQIIDGGYFDNEGLQTAVELAWWIAHHTANGRQVEPVLVQATADADIAVANDLRVSTIPRCSAVFADTPEVGDGRRRGDQLTAPAMGLYDVRAGHGGLILRQTLNQYCPSRRFFNFYLFKQSETHNVPLNWTLSSGTSVAIWNNIELGPNSQELGSLRETLESFASQ